jgi:hypothetical protein
MEEQGMKISSGLFDDDGSPARPEESKDRGEDDADESPHELRLGLRRDHPLIQHLAHSPNPLRIYYALTFLAHQLVLCQSQVAPGSRSFHAVKTALATDIRSSLIQYLDEETNTGPSEGKKGRRSDSTTATT